MPSQTKMFRFPGMRRDRIAAILGASVLLALPLEVGATEPSSSAPDDDKPVVTAEIVVTAGSPELLTEEQIEGARIDDETTDTAEIFRALAGTSAVRRASINLEPVVRGLQEDQVAVLVDGTRTFAAGPARMDSNLSHLGPHAVGGLRLVKGPYALAWGSGALSAIALDTWRPPFDDSGFDWQGRLGASVSDNAGAVDGRLGLWGGGERFRFRLDVGHRSGDDYEDGNGSTVPGDYTSNESRLRLGWRPSRDWLIELSGGYQKQEDLDYPGRLLDATYFYTRSYNLEVVREGRGDRVRQVQAQVYANHKDHRMNNDEKPTGRDMPGRIPPFALDVDLPTESNTQGGRFRVDLQEGPRAWALGVDFYDLDPTASRTVARRSNGFVLFEDIVWPDANVQNLGGWGQLVFSGDRYRVASTVRVDSVDVSTGALSVFFLANTDPSADLEPSETHVSAAVSAVFETGASSQLSVGIGRAVRSASVLERYSDRFPATKFQIAAEFVGNPELDPEESLELDVGWRTSRGDFVFEIDAFYRVIDDYITVAVDPTLPRRLPLSPTTVYRYVNGDEATFWGGELQLRQRIDERWSWRGALSYVRAEDEQFDEPVLGIAPLGGQAALRYTTLDGDLWFEGAVRFADRQDRVAASRFEQETPGWVVYDLVASWQLGERWGLRLDIENLTDHAYAQHLNAPNPFSRQRVLEIGREVVLGLDLAF